MDGDGNRHVEIVALATEDGVRLHADGDEEVAVLAAVAPDVPLALHANPRLVRQSGRQFDGERLGPHLDLLPAAGRTTRPAADVPTRRSARTAWKTPCARAPTSRRRSRGTASNAFR